jgi:hypothetical protein
LAENREYCLPLRVENYATQMHKKRGTPSKNSRHLSSLTGRQSHFFELLQGFPSYVGTKNYFTKEEAKIPKVGFGGGFLNFPNLPSINRSWR